MEQKLIARDRECSMIRDCMESDRSEFVIVYGRRRVGKTFLIDQYFKMNYDFSKDAIWHTNRTSTSIPIRRGWTWSSSTIEAAS